MPRQCPSTCSLRITDDDGAAMALDTLGTIELRVFHIHAETRSKPFRPSAFDGVGAVHERSKKAGAHCVSYVACIAVPCSAALKRRCSAGLATQWTTLACPRGRAGTRCASC